MNRDLARNAHKSPKGRNDFQGESRGPFRHLTSKSQLGAALLGFQCAWRPLQARRPRNLANLEETPGKNGKQRLEGFSGLTPSSHPTPCLFLSRARLLKVFGLEYKVLYTQGFVSIQLSAPDFTSSHPSPTQLKKKQFGK